MFTLKFWYRLLFALIIGTISWYIFYLVKCNYINLFSDFDLETINLISPFLGNFIGPFIALASALLFLENLKEVRRNNYMVLENLNEFKRNNLEKKNKEKREVTLKQCQIYLIDFQNDFKAMSDLGIPGNVRMISNYLDEPLNYLQITNNATWKNQIQTILVDNNRHSKVVLHLSKLESFSAYFLHGDLDLELGKTLISKYYVEQIRGYLPFIAYYRIDDESPFGNNILELFKFWGGSFKELLDQMT